MAETWETQLYNEIIDAYQRFEGRNVKIDPYVYQQLIKLMEMIKDKVDFSDLEKLKDVVTNAIVLLLTLFFDKRYDNDSGNNKPTAADQKTIKSVLNDAYSILTKV